MVQRYPFQPLYLLEGARRIQAAVRIPVVYIGGLLSRADLETVMQAGFPFAMLGRATVRDPNFVRRLASGEITASDCDHCNRCIAAMDAGGLTCVSAEKGLLPD
jgi:2,4-dienoyl-CoA reductase-like NADH-dependent reductase (Old Yellow Enzyme family)